MSRPLAGLVAVLCSLVFFVLLLVASHVGERNRCGRIDPAASAYAVYGCGGGR